MSSESEAKLGAGLGYAGTLLQVHLGLGLVLVIVGAAGKSSKFSGWEVTLRSAAAAAGPVPLLAAFALVQAGSNFSDFLTFAGLGAATASVFLGMLLALLIPTLGLDVADVNSKTGEIICESFDNETPAAARLAKAVRAVSALRFLGSALLIFGALPTGGQLLFSSLTLRLALLVHAASAATHALGITNGQIVAAAEHAAKAAPLAAGLGLLDHLAYGAAPLLHTPMQPAVYMAVAITVQVALILVSAGPSQEPLRTEFDLGLGASAGVASVAHLSIGALYLAVTLATGKVLLGTYALQVSLSGFSIEWGAPLVAAASLLVALFVVVLLLEMVLAHVPQASNGATNGEQHAAPSADTSIVGQTKALVAPALTLVLAMVTVHMGQSASTSVIDMTLAFAAMPFRLGFMAAAAGVGLQVVMLVFFVIMHCDDDPMPTVPFDGSGCLDWEPEGETLGKILQAFRGATLALLVGGLALGWVGLGLVPWLVIGVTMVPLTYVLLPAESKQVVNGVIMVMASAMGGAVGGFVDERQKALAAMAEKRAAEKAAALSAEMGEGEAKKKAAKGGGKGKGGLPSWKAPKKHK